MKILLIPVLGALLALPLSAADPKAPESFEEALRDAVKEYRSGKLDKARSALDKAAGILETQRAGKVADAFPDPPVGWSAGGVEKSQILPLLGGGRSVRKSYQEKNGRKEITLEVITDSSFGKLVAGLGSNEAIAASQGFKVQKIGSDSALLKGNELTLPVDDRVIIKLTAKGGAGEKELLSMAREVDRHALKKAQ